MASESVQGPLDQVSSIIADVVNDEDLDDDDVQEFLEEVQSDVETRLKALGEDDDVESIDEAA